MITILPLVLLLQVTAAPQPPLTVTSLRTEYLANPLGMGERHPRLSWRIASDARATMQAAYEIQAAATDADLARGRGLVWTSGRVASDQSVFVPYGGPALRSRSRTWWRVRVWDQAGRVSVWSEPAWFETGLLEPADWSAKWIAAPWAQADTMPSPSPLLRKSFRVSGTVRSARIYTTALGLYELELNGRPVSDALFTPGWTAYRHRIQVQTYDVTGLLQPGANAIGAMLGDGWYRGYLGFFGQRNIYGRRLALRLQLEITYTNGRTERVASDGSWTTIRGPVLTSDIYNGETYDARREQPGWSTATFAGSGWTPVDTLPAPAADLVEPVSPPVRRVRELKPVAITRAPSGETLFDLGQNFTGWARLVVRGPAGTTVTMRFGEVLQPNGDLYTGNLRNAAQTDRYTLKGEGREVFEPHFTFHGFRYVAVAGLPMPADTATITGVAISSDLAQTSLFQTSDSLLNRLQRNIVWGQRSNFLDVPTDCPQRDERLGWTGDAQVFAPTAAFNMDVNGFFAKWLADAAADQDPSGSMPWVIPNPMGGDSLRFAGTAGWGDFAVIVPWTMYQAYGDRRLLERQYPSMKAWVEFERRRAGAALIWRPGWQFGDWLAFHSDDASYPGATTTTEFIATAFLAHSADLLARSAEALGNPAEAAHYDSLFTAVRAAFGREFVTRSGRVGENTQTAYALALAFDLLPDDQRPQAAQRLAADIRAHGTHLTSGFIGTPWVLPVLSGAGMDSLAFALLEQRSYPSWLYPLGRGATTMWERWDGIRPDGSFEDPSMNSFNHYAFGAVGDWMYRTVGGIAPDSAEPGWRHARIAPRIGGGGLTAARAGHDTPYGTLATAWWIAGGTTGLEVVVPPNTTADVVLRGVQADDVQEGDVPLRRAPGILSGSRTADGIVVTVGSGHYLFTWPARQ